VILALDTSGGELLACLLDDDGTWQRGAAEPGGRHQARILGVVEELLGGTRAAQLTAIAVARGPGAQTGLRVGLATAEGLGFGGRLPLLSLSSLAVAAHRLVSGGDVVAAVSAGRSNVYAQVFTASGPQRAMKGGRVRCSINDMHVQLDVDPATPVAAEPAVLAGMGGGVVTGSSRNGWEALAAAAREALLTHPVVTYDGLAGDYGDR